MYWHQSHQLSPFKSIAPRQVAFTHDFAEILRRLFLLWRHNFVTWPDPTKYFSPKVAQRMPHKLWKISARSSKRCGVQLRKTHGGGGLHQPPPLTGRGLTRALMRSGELRVLMRRWPNGPPSVSSKVRVVEEKFKRRCKDLVELYRIRLCWLYFLTCDVTGRSKMVKKGQNVPIYGSQLFVT